MLSLASAEALHLCSEIGAAAAFDLSRLLFPWFLWNKGIQCICPRACRQHGLRDGCSLKRSWLSVTFVNRIGSSMLLLSLAAKLGTSGLGTSFFVFVGKPCLLLVHPQLCLQCSLRCSRWRSRSGSSSYIKEDTLATNGEGASLRATCHK